MNLLEAARAVVMTRRGYQACQPADNEKWINLHLAALDNLEKAIATEDASKVVQLKKGKAP